MNDYNRNARPLTDQEMSIKEEYLACTLAGVYKLPLPALIRKKWLLSLAAQQEQYYKRKYSKKEAIDILERWILINA